MQTDSTTIGSVFPRDRLVQVVYHDGAAVRYLKGRILGLTEDKAFLLVERPQGDKVLVARSAIRSIQPDYLTEHKEGRT